MKFRKKQLVIEAVQWKGELTGDIIRFSEGNVIKGIHDKPVVLTLGGVSYELSVGDWIIKGVKGEFYPCKPDIFEQTYDKVDDDESDV